MSRLSRFLLLPTGAGALVAVARQVSRRSHEHPQPFFADVRRAPSRATIPEPVVAAARAIPQPVVIAPSERALGA